MINNVVSKQNYGNNHGTQLRRHAFGNFEQIIIVWPTVTTRNTQSMIQC